MVTEAPPSEAQIKSLRQLILEAQGDGARFADEIGYFARSFREGCGHNKLEQFGVQWNAAISPAQNAALSRNAEAATAFAPHLHRALMCHLLPTDMELAALGKAGMQQWIMALRMGIQGAMRRRARLMGCSHGSTDWSQPTEQFLHSLHPVIRRAADDFFAARPN